MHAFAKRARAPRKTKPAASKKLGRLQFGTGGERNYFLRLQRIVGNRAVQRLLKSHAVSNKPRSTSPETARFEHSSRREPAAAKAPVTLTYSSLAAGPFTVKVNRFGESEHKKIGNLAATKFPYFAKVATDEVALRSSAKGRRTGNQFHNLVASLRKDGRVLVVGNVSKWMRVMVHSGAALDRKSNKPIDAAGLTGYVSEELVMKESSVFDQELPLLPGLTLTYGDLTALGGDHFKKFTDLIKFADPKTNAGGIDKIKTFVDVVEGKRKGEFEDPNTIDKEWAERYKNLAFENVSHFSHGGTAVDTWKKNHYQALMAAAKAGYFSDIGSLQRAYAMNGFADHFLTDTFSSGHVRVPRMKILQFYQDFFDKNLDSILNYIYTSIGNQMMVQLFQDHPRTTGTGIMLGNDFCADNKRVVREFKNQAEKEMKDNNLQPSELKKLLVQYIGGAVSKVLHDDDNTAGLQVKSKKHPQGWKAFGDGKLDASFQDYIIEAVVVSKNEVIQAFNIGIDFKKTTGDTKLYEKIKPLVYPISKVEDYIPETDTAKSTPLPEWKIDMTGWDTMDKSVQNRLATLIKKYLDDKTLEAMIAKIPLTVEEDVTGPNVYFRPRDATRHVLVRFRDNPVDFITSAASAPKDFSKALDKVLLCPNPF
jgi:hypothetical protein